MVIEFKINDKIDCSLILWLINNIVNKNKLVMIIDKVLCFFFII